MDFVTNANADEKITILGTKRKSICFKHTQEGYAVSNVQKLR